MRQILDELERTLGEPDNLASTLQHIALTAQKCFEMDCCIIFASNPITGTIVTSPTIAENIFTTDQRSFSETELAGLVQQLLTREFVVVEDSNDPSDYQNNYMRLDGIRSYIGLPLQLKYRQKLLGILYMYSKQPLQFESFDRKLFQLFAEQASFILQETWLLRRYQEVAKIGQEINHELSKPEALFKKLQKHIIDVLDTRDAFLLAIYQPQANNIDLYLEDGGQTIIRENDALEGACKHVIEKRETLLVRQMSEEAKDLPFQRVRISTDSGPKESLIFVPLVFRDVSLGVLSIQHKEPNTYNQEDLSILQLLANHIALALYNIRLFDNLRRLSETGQ
ncbi:MAG TPA: GAF domain-containing protein, partial [Ktedonobacteraceae bacterium]|nr:GAF domain-containing protein [Ktedonobacteraceae bacterium]